MEQMANRAQTIVADTFIAAVAFLAAYLLSATRALGLDSSGLTSLNLFQLVAIYAALAAGFSTMFRRELSPWRYVSIPDALVLARTAILTAGVFLLTVFVIDRANGLARSVLAMAPVFQMVGCMGARIMRRALHEHALDSFAPLKSIQDRAPQAPSLLLIGPTALADTYLRDVARRHDHAWTPVGIVGPEPREVGQQVRGVCIIESIENLDAALADPARSCSLRSRAA
jgi:O-antigen biosynthesis protein WbqV